MDKNTGDYIRETYTKELHLLEDKARLLETPADIAARNEKEKIIQKAQELISLNILNEGITKGYLELDAKIKEKKENIEHMYGIEIKDDSLEAVRNAKDVLLKQFENEETRLKTETDQALDSMNENASQVQYELQEENKEMIAALDNQIKDLQESFKQEFDREQAEYTYQLERKRKLDAAQRMQEVTEREAQLALRENDVKDKMAECEKRLQEIEEMQKLVNDIPMRIEAARKRGSIREEKRPNKGFDHSRTINEMEYKHKIEVLQTRYDRLMEKIELLQKEKESIIQRLDECHNQSRMLTSDTVRSIGGINILNGDNNAHSVSTGKRQ